MNTRRVAALKAQLTVNRQESDRATQVLVRLTSERTRLVEALREEGVSESDLARWQADRISTSGGSNPARI